MRLSTRTAAVATVVLGLAGVIATTATTEAHAGPGPFGAPPIECEFQSTWTKKACTVGGNTFPWNYSVAKIKSSPAYSTIRRNAAMVCADDTFNQWPYAKYIAKGDTLWNLAVKAYGNGMQYRTIKKLNGLRGTTIKPGQWLIIKDVPAECRAVNPNWR